MGISLSLIFLMLLLSLVECMMEEQSTNTRDFGIESCTDAASNNLKDVLKGSS